jgi:hypothetical protein
MNIKDDTTQKDGFEAITVSENVASIINNDMDVDKSDSHIAEDAVSVDSASVIGTSTIDEDDVNNVIQNQDFIVDMDSVTLIKTENIENKTEFIESIVNDENCNGVDINVTIKEEGKDIYICLYIYMYVYVYV